MPNKKCMFRTLTLIAFTLMCKVAIADCVELGADPLRPLNGVADKAHRLLLGKNFKELEILSIKYRLPNSFAADGQPNLIGFYEGVSKGFSNCRKPIEVDELLKIHHRLLQDLDQEASGSTENAWENHHQLLLEWKKTIPESVSAQIALAGFEIAYAWHTSQYERPKTAQESRWILLKERMTKVKSLLDGYAPSVRADPQWYAYRLAAAFPFGAEKESFDKIFNEAVQKFPDYYDLYTLAYAFHGPQWYGSNKESKTVLDTSVKLTQSKPGTMLYGRVYPLTTNWMFTSGEVDWPKMKQGFERITHDFPDAWNYNKFAKFACVAKDTDTLKKQLALMGDKVVESYWPEGWLKYCKELVAYADGKKCYRRQGKDYTWCE